MNTGKRQRQRRLIGKLFLVLYLIFLIYFLLFSNWYGRTGELETYHYNLIPFSEIIRFWTYRESLGLRAFANLAGNVLVFMPVGFFLALGSRRKSILRTILFSFAVSLSVEVSQFILRVGRFDVDDLILNTCGGFLGLVAFAIYYVMRRSHDKNLAGKRTEKVDNT